MVCLRSTPECREYICSNLFSGWEIASCWIPPILLYKKPYLSTAVHSCFVLPMSCYYSSPICLCSEQQITVGLFLSLGQPTVFFLFRLCASSPHCPHSFIVFGSVLPALFIKCKTAGGQQSSVERHCAPPLRLSDHCPEIMEKPCQREGPSVTSAQWLAHSSGLIDTFTWGWRDEDVHRLYGGEAVSDGEPSPLPVKGFKEAVEQPTKQRFTKHHSETSINTFNVNKTDVQIIF